MSATWSTALAIFAAQPVRLDDEKRALIYRMYEVYPKNHQLAGRRRFKRVFICLPKGVGKTELAAWIAAVELHPRRRFAPWVGRRAANRFGGPVTDPYIPMVAYTEEQSDELALRCAERHLGRVAATG